MTLEELEAIAAGIAPVIREQLDAAKQRADGLALEINTLRESLIARSAEFETRYAILVARVIELESAAAVRS